MHQYIIYIPVSQPAGDPSAYTHPSTSTFLLPFQSLSLLPLLSRKRHKDSYLRRQRYIWGCLSFFHLTERFWKYFRETVLNQSRASLSHKKAFHIIGVMGSTIGRKKCLPLDVRPDQMSGLSGKSYLFPPVTALHCVLLLSDYSTERKRRGREREKERKVNYLNTQWLREL